MKFKFSLEKVLKHREILVDLAKKDFLEAEMALNHELSVLNQMEDEKKSALQQRSDIVGGSGSWSVQVEQINVYLKGQDLRITRQIERLKDFEKVVEERREILRKALVEAKIIERLREKKLEEFRSEMKRNEQKEIDEIVSMRHGRFENTTKGENEDGI